MEKLKGPRRRVVTLRIERALYYYLGCKAQELELPIDEYIDRYFYSWLLSVIAKQLSAKEVQQDV